MPNRIIKESICTSEDLDKVSPCAEILFYRLIVKADDFGAYYGNEKIVKSTCFPLKSDVIRSEQVKAWLSELSSAGLIIRYVAPDEREYIQIVKWDKHQQIRAKKSKFPLFDSACMHLISDDCKCPRNPIQSNPIRNTIQNPIQSNAIAFASDEDDGFEQFWNAYPRKTGDIKQAYMEYIGALQNGATLTDMLDAIKWQAATYTPDTIRFFPSAEKWLRNRGWTEQKPEAVADNRTDNIFAKMLDEEQKKGGVPVG